MLYCSSECGSISIMQLRIIYCNTHVYTFHVCLCLLALTLMCVSKMHSLFGITFALFLLKFLAGKGYSIIISSYSISIATSTDTGGMEN